METRTQETTQGRQRTDLRDAASGVRAPERLLMDTIIDHIPDPKAMGNLIAAAEYKVGNLWCTFDPVARSLVDDKGTIVQHQPDFSDIVAIRFTNQNVGNVLGFQQGVAIQRQSSTSFKPGALHEETLSRK